MHRLRPLLSLLLPLLLCTCGPAQNLETVLQTAATGSVRYHQDQQILEASLNLSPAPAKAPSLFGTLLPTLPETGPGNYKLRKKIAFPTDFSFSLPCGKGQTTDCPLDFTFTPPFIDSLPAVMSRNTTIRFVAGEKGLSKQESLEVFFEPVNRSEPHRMLVQGPTKRGTITLPKLAMADLAPGLYDVYLVKQQLNRDSTAALQHSLQTEYFTNTRRVNVTE